MGLGSHDQESREGLYRCGVTDLAFNWPAQTRYPNFSTHNINLKDQLHTHTLHKGNFLKNTPKTTRDPTYASKQINNYAQTLSMVHEKRTSNTYNASPAVNRILRGGVSRAQATKKKKKTREQTTLEPKKKVGHGSSDSQSDIE